MKFTTKTEYGLFCLIYMARGAKGQIITVKDIVTKERFSTTYIEKIMQKLKAADIVTSFQGKEGGYALAREASEITVREIIEALEGQLFDIYCRPKKRKGIVCTHFGMCELEPIWRRTNELLENFFGSITLEQIANEKSANGALKI